VAIWARRAESLEEALQGGYADFASCELEAVVRDADLVVLCTPIGAMPALAREIVSSISPQTLVTDVGSVKGPVVAALAPIFALRGRFVGSHPMAGSDQSGMKASRADLFSGSVCILTPEPASDLAAVAAIEAFWRGLGCQVRQVSAEEHDSMVALVSHFPHLLAASLVDMVAEQNPCAFEFCGPGFRDTTRVAGGSAAMWSEILLSNRQEVRNSTDAMIEKLSEIRKLLDSDFASAPMTEFLTRAKSQREGLGQSR
jgi:prephenate dehydrogenase